MAKRHVDSKWIANRDKCPKQGKPGRFFRQTHVSIYAQPFHANSPSRLLEALKQRDMWPAPRFGFFLEQRAMTLEKDTIV